MLNDLRQAATDKAGDVSKRTRGLAQKTSAQAKEKSQQVYVQAQSGLQRATVAATAAGVLLQGLSRYYERKSRKNLQQARRKARHLQDAAQPTLQAVWPKVQDELETTQHVLKKGLGTAQDTLQKRSAKAEKNLKRAQKAAQERLGSGWSKAQDSLEIGWSATQDILEEGAEQIRKTATRVSSKKKDIDESLKKRYKHYQRKRALARRLFRWGLISGFIIALLFAPVSGAETRKRLGALWNQYKQYLVRDEARPSHPVEPEASPS